jgi:hypothetical protein
MKNITSEFIDLLYESMQGDRIRWKVIGNNTVAAKIDGFNIVIRKNSDLGFVLDITKDDYEFNQDLKVTDENFAKLSTLYQIAFQHATRPLEDLLRSLKSTSFTTTTTTTTPEPPTTHGIYVDDSIFKRICGAWHLDYFVGDESIEINEIGNYFILSSKGIWHPKKRHAFNLDILTYDSVNNQYRVQKVTPDGRPYNIEVLKIEDRRMEGWVENDGRKLLYTRQ